LLADQNPWWSERAQLPAEIAPPVERTLTKFLWRTLQRDEPRRFQVVLGPRRVGKTTAMYQTLRRLLEAGIPRTSLWWLRLDHPLLTQVPLGNWLRPSSHSSQQPRYFFLDELTYAADWDRWLKSAYDERWPVRVVGSSSAAGALRRGSIESGAGRWSEQHLAPYTFAEYLDLRNQAIPTTAQASLRETLADAGQRMDPTIRRDAELRRFLIVGGFPELLNLPEAADEVSEILRSQRVLRADAVERAVYKDIPQVAGVSEPLKLERLLYALGGQMTGVLSPSKLAAELGMTVPTFERYLGFLQHAFLVFLLPSYAGSEQSIQRRGRKLYFFDGAVRNAALQRGLAPLRQPAEFGLMLENAVAAQLHALSQQSGVRLYHWRHGAYEVDLIYDDPNGPVAIEVANSPRHSLTGLRALRDRFPKFNGACYLVGPGVSSHPAESSRDGIGSLPIDHFLTAAGAQMELAMQQRFA
jgi:hypothetical protein